MYPLKLQSPFEYAVLFYIVAEMYTAVPKCDAFVWFLEKVIPYFGSVIAVLISCLCGLRKNHQ